MRDYKLKLDVMDSEFEFDELWFMKGDMGGYIELELKDNNTLMDLSNSSVIAIFEKKDKTVTQKEVDILDLENSIIKLDMLNSIIDVVGKVKCFIKIYKGESVTTFSPFTITVKKSISLDDVVDSYTELDILQIVNRNTENITINTEGIKKVSNDLEALSESVNDDIYTVNENIVKLEENSSEAIKIVKEEIETLSKNTTEDLKDLSKNTIEKLDNLSGDIENVVESLNPINNNIKELQDNKANIIISLEEPDTTNLKIGTIWIKPVVVDE